MIIRHAKRRRPTFRRIAAPVLWAAALALAPAAARGASPVTEYVETFETTVNRDPGNLSADWDTAAGEARFFPYSTTVIGSLAVSAYGVAVRGDLAYVAAGSPGLAVVDVSDPANPAVLGSLGGFSAVTVDVAADIAAVACGNAGLLVVDVSDPAAPVVAGSIDPGSVDAVEIVGTLVYAAGGTGFFVIDISDPATPAVVGSTTIPNAFSLDIDVAGDRVYVAAGNTVAVVDVSDPANPAVGFNGAAGSIAGVAANGDLLHVADVSVPGMRIYDVSDPFSPVLLSTFTASFITFDVAVSGNWAYLATRNAGVTIVNVADPANPVLDEIVDTPGSTERITVSGNLLFAADSGGGLRILELGKGFLVSTPVFPTVGTSQSVFVDGNTAYVCEGAGGLTVVDVTDVNAPSILANLPLPDVDDVFVDGDHAYAVGQGGFWAVDVSDPSTPTVLGSAFTGQFDIVFDVWVEGDVAYVTTNYFTTTYWVTIDVSDPANPLPLNFEGFIIPPWDIVVEGNLALVATAAGLETWDVTDPAAPLLLDSIGSPGLYAVDMDGDLAYAVSDSKLHVFDIGDPTAVVEIAAPSLTQGGTPMDVRADGDYLFVAADSIGIYGFDVSNPAAPILVWYSLQRTRGIFLDGELIYRALGDQGLAATTGHNRDFDASFFSVLSTTLPSGPDSVRAIRTTTVTNAPLWRNITADGGANWMQPEEGVWATPPAPGTDVRFLITVARLHPLVNSLLEEVRLEYLYAPPVLGAVDDIPGDQGGQVRLTWTRSVHDDPADPVPVLEYAIYRKIDPGSPAPETGAEGSGRRDRETPGTAPALAGWDYVLSVPAEVDDVYSTVVPTLADSTSEAGTVYSTFLVRARTAVPGTYYESAPDSGYSVDNLPPNTPQNLSATYGTGSGNLLSWDPPADSDFRYFAVYRGATPDFSVGQENLAGTTVATEWTDPAHDGGGIHYKLTAFDFAGNESPAASPGQVVGVRGEALPPGPALAPGSPSPFRSATSIRYQLPAGGGFATLQVFDVTGRLVRTLLRGHRPEGSHQAVWDGRNDAGEAVRSGVYFSRLQVGSEVRTHSVTRLR